MNFFETVQKHFNFLQEYGYNLLCEDNNSCVNYIGKNKVSITCSLYSYELDCYFVDIITKKSFCLQDALNYHKITDFRGVYQFSKDDEMENGVNYLANAVKKVYEIMDISNPINFKTICCFATKKRDEELKEYYIAEELKKADYFWINELYVDAANIYKKYLNDLSRLQKKRLKYIDDKMS